MPRKTPRSRPEIAPENWSQSSTTTRLRQSVTVQPEPADEAVSSLPEPMMPPTLPLPHRSPEIPRSRLRSGPVFSAALKCHLRSAAFRPPPSEYTEFPAPPLPSSSPAVRSASVPAQKSQVPEPAAQSSGYRESQVHFPLVKDIVGYLKMCHSILPIKR